MWQWLRARLLHVGFGLLLVAWLVCSVVIAVWLFRTTALDADRRSAPALVVLVFAVPVFVVTAIDEFIVHRIKHGPPAPASHRGTTRRPIDMPNVFQVTPFLGVALVVGSLSLGEALNLAERMGALLLALLILVSLLAQVTFAFRRSRTRIAYASVWASWLSFGTGCALLALLYFSAK